MHYDSWLPENRQRSLTAVIPDTDADIVILRNALADAVRDELNRTFAPNARHEAGLPDTRRPSVKLHYHIGEGVFNATITRYLPDGETAIPCRLTYNLRYGAGRSGKRDIGWTTPNGEQAGFFPAMPPVPTDDADIDVDTVTVEEEADVDEEVGGTYAPMAVAENVTDGDGDGDDD